MTDHIGRRVVYISVLLFQSLAFLMNIYVNHFWINAIGNAFIIVGVSLNYAILLVILSESIPAGYRNKSASILFICEISGFIAFNIIEIF